MFWNRLSLKKSNRSNRKFGNFLIPKLDHLESRVNPVNFTANVLYNSGVIEVQLTSTGVNAAANTLTISNTNSTTLLFDAGAGNTITFTDQTSGNLNVQTTQGVTATIGTNGNAIAGLKMMGNVGQDRYTFNDLNASTNPLTTAASFGVTIDSASIASANNQDTLTINGTVRVTGTGNFTTSNSNPTQNLNQITINNTGRIQAVGSGSILLVANQGGTSNVDITGVLSGSPFTSAAIYSVETATVNAGDTAPSGSVTILAGGSINLGGDAIKTNGGAINLSSAVNLQNATNIFTGTNKANVTFSSTVNGTQDLTVNSGGILNFNSSIGQTNTLGNITTLSITGLNVAGNVSAASFNTSGGVKGDISFGGIQNYSTITGLNLAATKRNATQTDAGAPGNITLGGAVTLVPNATLNFAHDGLLTINGNITNGIFTEIPSITAGVTPQVSIAGLTTITSNAGISFISPVTLNGNLTLVTANNQGVSFNSTLDGPAGLTLNTNGDVLFGGKVGSLNPVNSISTQSGTNPSTLTFNDTLVAGSLQATVQGNVNLTKDQTYFDASGLVLATLSANSNIRLGKINSSAASSANVSISNAGPLFINDDIIIGGNFVQSSMVTGITITNGGSGYVSYPTVNFNPNGTISNATATSYLGISQGSLAVIAGGGGNNYNVGDIVQLVGTAGAGNISGTYNATATVASIVGGAIGTLTLLDGGKYNSASSTNGLTGLSITRITGNGSGGTVNATGFVNDVVITNNGSGFTSAPAISFAGGLGTGGITAVGFSNIATPTGQVFIGNLGNNAPITLDAGLSKDITFSSLINLNQDLILNTSTQLDSDITLGAIEGGTLTLLPDITITTGGNVTFNGTIGATNSLGAIDMSPNLVNSVTATATCLGIKAASMNIGAAGAISLTAPQVYSGTELADGNVFGLNLSNTNSSATITLGQITTSEFFNTQIGSIVVNNGGSNFVTSPAVTIQGGNGSGATASATLGVSLGSTQDGTIVIDPAARGAGYTVGQVVQLVQEIGASQVGFAIAEVTSVLGINNQLNGLRILSSGGGFTDLGTLKVQSSGYGGTVTQEAVVSAIGFINAISLTNGGIGYTSIPNVVIAPPTFGATATAVLASTSNSITIGNNGFLILQGNINAKGNFIQNGQGDVTVGNTLLNPIPAVNLNTLGGNISFNSLVTLQGDFLLNSSVNSVQSGNITFNKNIDSPSNKNLSLVAGVAGQGSLSGSVLLRGLLGVNPMGDITVSNPSSFGVVGDVNANSLVINGSNGAVTFSASINLDGTTSIGGNNVSLSVETLNSLGLVVFQNAISADGDVIINNTGSLISSSNSDILTSGSFKQTGFGASFVSGDIKTTGGSISFTSPVSFSAKPIFSASNTNGSQAGIDFQNDVNGPGGVSVEATGKIQFLGNIGLLNSLSTLEVVNSVYSNSQDLVAVVFNNSSGQRFNVGNLTILNTNGRIVFNGQTNIQTSLTTNPQIYDLVFENSTTFGGNSNFLNGGNVKLSNNTNFIGSTFFNNSGSLDLSGNVVASGNLNVQRPVNISKNLDLFITSPNNTFGSTVAGSSTISINNGGTLTLGGNSPLFTGNFLVNSSVLNGQTVSSVLQVSALYNNASVSLNGGKLTGSGRVLNVLNAKSGTFSPGTPVGNFTIGNQLNIGSPNTFLATVNGTGIGSYGQVSMLSGSSININNSNLSVVLNTNLQVGNQLTLINVGNGSSVLGNFKYNGSVVPQGGSFSVNSNGVTTTFNMNYLGGDGNDVVISVASVNPFVPPPGTILPAQAIGVDYGGGSVVQINYNNGANATFFAYSPAYTGGVRVAMGDINGDGFADLITSTGLGGGPHIKVFNLVGGAPVEMATFYAFEPNFTSGVYVASGDINNDGYDDIVMGAGSGGGPRVKVVYGASGFLLSPYNPMMDFFAYDPAFTGGVRVACGDRDGNGFDDVITGAGVGGAPNVRSFNYASIMIDNFMAFDPALTTGIFVGAGYVDNDSTADIIAGSGRGAPTQISAFYSSGARSGPVYPFSPIFTGGASVGVALNSLGQEVFSAAAGPGGAPQVNLLDQALNTTSSFYGINVLFSGGLFLNPTL